MTLPAIHGTSKAGALAVETLDVAALRKDFPALAQRAYGKPLVYLDNAATTQKPQAVIDAVVRFYAEDCANVHRGVHLLSQRATDVCDRARLTVKKFLGASSEREIIFTSGTTASLNLVAHSWGRYNLKAGDEIVISAMEHHSNIVPWQILCEDTGAILRVAPINDAGELLLDEFESLVNGRTRIVAVNHVSNALGSENPVKEIVGIAHRHGAIAIIDGAQAVAHMPVNVRELDCDFYAMSGHKIFGPTGVGVLYGKQELLEAMRPYQGGGDMILSVTFEKTTYNELPFKFEAGTPNVAGQYGLGAALEYVNKVGLEAISAYEHELLAYATEQVGAIDGVRLIGTAKKKASVLSFVVEGIHPHDMGTILDREGVAVRAGHHCAQPVMDRLGVPATTRASFAFYNTKDEVDALAAAIRKAKEIFG
jgi:cysteine desulfurase/selenocysteine lyase